MGTNEEVLLCEHHTSEHNPAFEFDSGFGTAWISRRLAWSAILYTLQPLQVFPAFSRPVPRHRMHFLQEKSLSRNMAIFRLHT
jgi:hypothetical protein